jgi:CBS domain-containing protein
MRVHEAMKPDVRALDQREPLAFAQVVLLFSTFRHLPVVDGARRVVGMLTARDLLDGLDEIDPEQPFTVRAAIRRPPVTIGRDEDVEDALRRMRREGIHALPVTDAGAHLVGIITDVDVLAALVARRGDCAG